MRLPVILMSLAGLGLAETQCKCSPSDPCWPSASSWAALNTSVSGKLIHNQPVAKPCYHGAGFDRVACEHILSQWSNSTFQANHPVAYALPLFDACPPLAPGAQSAAHCSLGPDPVYTVNATEPQDLVEGIRFARYHDIRLVVRTTGHDLLGRSQGYGSLQVWTKYVLKGIEHHSKYTSVCAASNWAGNAFTVRGGYIWSDLYEEAFKRNLTVVGGADKSVGILGGYLQGGGHSPVSHDYGLAADQLLEAQVVLASGNIVTVNACQHRDLFFAIRGGGGSTYGIVISASLKAYPSRPVVVQYLQIAPLLNNANPMQTPLLDAVTEIVRSYPALSDAGFSGYGLFDANATSLASINILKTVQHTGIYMHGFAKIAHQNSDAPRDFLVDAQSIMTSILMERLLPYNGTSLLIMERWRHFPSYEGYFQAISENPLPIGYSNAALTSRLFDKSALTGDRDRVRQMLKIISSEPQAPSSDNSDNISTAILFHLIGGGKVLKPNPLAAVNPAWRKTYLHAVVGSTWPERADTRTIQGAQDSITFQKTDAMKVLTPGMGSYMNEADRRDPLWKEDFYGANYVRLQSIKRQYDPDHVFYCHTCVGSEEWIETDLGGGKGYGPLCRV
ncbi:hypothetical protein N7510_003791 [Penicillium lagena]|uniref:uncharacterized protein n=1 Tax=Penicillium lagena TaxID=94218 RepID=UPI00253FF516|nr:uncharacterized protein N7510_003791 [Penicillium lagena]KAJ5619807.1 hypothetical protein N7510_003791 [Penicillium lagena]